MSNTLVARKSPIAGRGCFTLAPQQRGKKIAAFAGELVKGKRNILARLDDSGVNRVVWLNDQLAIDTAVGGDATAYINHSCAPNAYMRSAAGNRVLIFALRDIEAGEEITVDYRDPDHPAGGECRCGAPNCRSAR